MEYDREAFVTPDSPSVIENVSPQSGSKNLHVKRLSSPTDTASKLASCESKRNIQAKRVTPDPPSLLPSPSYDLPSCSDENNRSSSFKQCPNWPVDNSAVWPIKMTPTKLAQVITSPRFRSVDLTQMINPRNDQFVPPRDDPYWDFRNHSPQKTILPITHDLVVDSCNAAALELSTTSLAPDGELNGLSRKNPPRAKRVEHPGAVLLRAPKNDTQNTYEPMRAKSVPKSKKSAPKTAAKSSKKSQRPRKVAKPRKSSKASKRTKADANLPEELPQDEKEYSNQTPVSTQAPSPVPEPNNRRHKRKAKNRYRQPLRYTFDAFELCRPDPDKPLIDRVDVAAVLESSNAVELINRSFTKRPREYGFLDVQRPSSSTDTTFLSRPASMPLQTLEAKEKRFKEAFLDKSEPYTQYYHAVTKKKLSDIEEVKTTERFLRCSNDDEKFKWKLNYQINNVMADELQNSNGMAFGRSRIKLNSAGGRKLLKPQGVSFPFRMPKECSVPSGRIGFTPKECQSYSNRTGKQEQTAPGPSTTEMFGTSKKEPNDCNSTVAMNEEPSGRMLYKPDLADMIWLENEAKKTLRNHQKPIMYSEFEQIMNILEVESYMRRCRHQLLKLEAAQHTFQNPDDAPCCICLQEEHDHADAILFCDGCDIAVHTSCYGVSEVPEGDWYCDACKYQQPFASCWLCPVPNGAVHRTAVLNLFVHTTCALWHPSAVYKDLPNRKKLFARCILHSPTIYIPCSVCGIKSGAVLFCSMDGCGKPYHVGCADRCGFWMEEVEQGPNKIEYRTYCSEHSKQKALHPGGPLPKGVNVRDFENRCIYGAAPGERILMFDELEPQFLAFSPKVDDDLFKGFDPDIVQKVHAYWVFKRVEHGRPMFDPAKIPFFGFPRFVVKAKHPNDIPLAREPKFSRNVLDNLKKLARTCEAADIADKDAMVTTVGQLKIGHNQWKLNPDQQDYAALVKSTSKMVLGECVTNCTHGQPSVSPPTSIPDLPNCNTDSDDGGVKRRRLLRDGEMQHHHGKGQLEACQETVVQSTDIQMLDDEPVEDYRKHHVGGGSPDHNAKSLFDAMVKNLNLGERKLNKQGYHMCALSEPDRIGFSIVLPEDERGDTETNEEGDAAGLEPELTPDINHRHNTRFRRNIVGYSPVKKSQLDDEDQADDSGEKEVDVDDLLNLFADYTSSSSVWAKWVKR